MNDKTPLAKTWKRSLWFLPPILIGIAVVIAAPLMKSGPEVIEATERAVKVRVIKVSELDVVPRVTGYGKIVPARTWDAVAEVAGQVVWVADDLRDGRIITSGTELLRIEESDFRLALAQIEAQLQASEVKNKTARDNLVIAKQELGLLRREYERAEKLAARGTVSKSSLEAAERQMLGGEIQVKTLQNSLDLNSAEHQVLIAQRDAAKLNLERTRKVAPFNVRIGAVNIGVAQYVNKGQLMFSADGLDIAEVAAQFPVGTLRPLIDGSDPEGMSSERQGALGLQAIVRLHTATHTVEWPARVSRVSGTIDPQTQSLGVVVAVDRPFELAQPGERPPLRRNTFVEVELSSSPLEGQVVVPLNAVQNGNVYVVDADSRLDKRTVQVDFSQQGYAVLEQGVKPGERIVVSDLITAVEGMLLDPQEDRKVERQMIMEATGKDPEK